MSQQVTLEDLLNATSSQGSGSGPTPCGAPDGPMTGPSGQDRAHVNPFQPPVNGKESMTKGICGLSGSGSSKPVGRPSSSGNRSHHQQSSVARLKELERDRIYQLNYRLRHRAKDLIRHAKLRSKKKGLPFDLDNHVEDIQARIDAGLCEVTGFPFNLQDGRTWDSPSLDRINPAEGYTYSNLRIVCHAINSAFGDWGEQRMVDLARAILARRRERSNDLSKKLAERLKERSDQLGSTLFRLTWKEHVTPSGRVIPRLRASGLPTSGSGCTSWPTPVANDDNKTPEAHLAMKKRMGERDGTGANRTAITSLQVTAKLASWPTPAANEFEQLDSDALMKRREKYQEKYGNNGFGLTVAQAAQLASWPTPRSAEAGPDYAIQDREQSGGFSLQTVASWATPSSRDWKDTPGMAQDAFDKSGKFRNRIDQLARQTYLTAGWQTGLSPQDPKPQLTASGQTPSGSPAGTEKRGQLNPEFSRWLMGLPPAWDDCAVMVTRSVRRSRKSS